MQSQTKYNNSLIEFQTALGKLLQPLQKLSFNLLSQGLDFVTQKFGGLSKIILNLAGVALLNLFGRVNVLNLIFVGLGNTLNGLILTFSNLWAAKLTIISQVLKFAGAYALVAVAIASTSNAINLSKNQYEYLNDNVEKLTAGMNRYREAVKAATTEQKNFGGNKVEQPQLNEGWKLPDNKFGDFLRPLVGGDRLNFDNVIRNRWNEMLDRMDAYNQAASGGTAPKLKGRTVTEAERRQADFQVAVGDLNYRANELLDADDSALNAATEITKFDVQIADIQSRRLELLPTEEEALKDSLSSEREINVARDKHDNQSRLAGYQEQLAQNILSNRSALIDFNRTISDYFFKITQQIKEAEIEILRIVNQIIQTNIKNKLQSALSPNAESFVNNLISTTQSPDCLTQVAKSIEIA